MLFDNSVAPARCGPLWRCAVDRLILASSSVYRRELLGRLRVPFDIVVRPVDERRRPGETPAEMALRLAAAKAQAVSEEHREAWVIGSDQVCEATGGRVLGKPDDIEQALDQLLRLSGSTAEFHTAVVMMRQASSLVVRRCVGTTVQFRVIDRDAALRYIAQEPALDCAGSFKAEGLGISLCERITSDDPTALLGLPLISVRRLLAQAGWELP